MLGGGYGGMRISAQGQRRGLRMSQTNLTPAVRLDHLRFQMSVDVDAAPLDGLVIGSIRGGRLTHRSSTPRPASHWSRSTRSGCWPPPPWPPSPTTR
jgi:hypothetical protein